MARWRRGRLAGNLRGIRFRLAWALALALAPILVLSALQSRAAYEEEVRRAETELIRAAERSAATAQARIDGAVVMLQTLTPESVGLYCVPRLREIVEREAAYEAMARVSATGRIQCASHSLAADDLIYQPWFERLREGAETAIAAAPPELAPEGDALLAATRIERPLGAFAGAFLAVVSLESLRPQAADGAAPDGTHVALVDAEGRLLTATDPTAFPLSGMDPRAFDGRLRSFRDGRGRQRVATAAAFAGHDVFVLASAPDQGLFSWAVANALGVFVLPLLTWAIALGCALVVTERFVIRWLAYLERVAAIHAKGRHNVRPVHALRAPAEIRNLASAMDAMVRAINARDASLRESLEEKDALMREIHHRVKNNLQVISSLLNMQQRALKEAPAKAALKDTRQRITALALIYRALYQSETLKEVDIAGFLNDLTAQLVSADSGHGPTVETEVQADPLVVDPDKLAPVALWAVEAISNAQKHAFTGRGGKLSVRFVSSPDESVLEIEDDGPGAPPDEMAQGLGATLMNAFARQLRGETRLARAPGGGLVARLSFPTPEVAFAAAPPADPPRNQPAA